MPSFDLPADLTPAQQLIVEVLSARHRLGETIWPFDSRLKKQLAALEQFGWVYLASGQVENTIRARLTEAAKRKVFLTSTYVSPLEQENIELAQDVEALTRLRSRGYEV